MGIEKFINKVVVTPSMVQPISKPINPLKGGISSEIIPWSIQTFIIYVPMTIIVSQLVKGSERFNKE
jgi:hypothetical protein